MARAEGRPRAEFKSLSGSVVVPTPPCRYPAAISSQNSKPDPTHITSSAPELRQARSDRQSTIEGTGDFARRWPSMPCLGPYNY
jgi:hypothetical protein